VARIYGSSAGTILEKDSASELAVLGTRDAEIAA
jgi:hypothetical protein